jgi:uncharacterized protein (DUF2237 family)
MHASKRWQKAVTSSTVSISSRRRRSSARASQAPAWLLIAIRPQKESASMPCSRCAEALDAAVAPRAVCSATHRFMISRRSG